MVQASPLVWFLAVPLGLVIAVAAGSFLLQAACALCNIEDLRFLKALGLMLLLILANVPIGLVLFFMSQGAVSGMGWDTDPVLAIALGLGYPLHWLISGLVLFWPLHVSYLKGVLVSILHNVLSFVVAGVLGGLILVVLAFVQLVGA
jgi:hypothetical protein